MEVLKLFFLVIFVTVEVYGQVPTKLDTILQGLFNFYTGGEVEFPNKEPNPIYLYDKANSQIIYTVSIPIASPITIELYDVLKNRTCPLASTLTLPHVGEYDAVLGPNNLVLISLRSSLRADSKYADADDIWQIFIVNTLDCTQKDSIVKSMERNYYIDSLKLRTNEKTFDVFRKLANQDGKTQLSAITFKYASMNTAFALKHYAPATKAETIMLDKYTDGFYVIKNTSLESMSILIEPTGYPYDVAYRLEPYRNISRAPKALKISNSRLTFCYGNEDNKLAIECAIYQNSGVPILLAEVSTIARQSVKEIILYHVDPDITLIFWIEGSSNTENNVMVKVLQGTKSVMTRRIYSSPVQIDSLTYSVSNQIHSLSIAIHNNLGALKKSFLFPVAEF